MQQSSIFVYLYYMCNTQHKNININASNVIPKSRLSSNKTNQHYIINAVTGLIAINFVKFVIIAASLVQCEPPFLALWYLLVDLASHPRIYRWWRGSLDRRWRECRDGRAHHHASAVLLRRCNIRSGGGRRQRSGSRLHVDKHKRQICLCLRLRSVKRKYLQIT